ncbi:MAG: hypothetical protein C0467_14960 [Planctomycetaceae bacterium]|nr:hypothetical protein [Planctomycetaceae bacterium]
MPTQVNEVVGRLDLQALKELRAALGYKPMSLAWAKCRIVLGLLACGSGVLLGNWTLSPGTELSERIVDVVVALTQIMVGGYLVLDGQRTHLYLSSDHLTAYLAEVIRQTKAS